MRPIQRVFQLGLASALLSVAGAAALGCGHESAPRARTAEEIQCEPEGILSHGCDNMNRQSGAVATTGAAVPESDRELHHKDARYEPHAHVAAAPAAVHPRVAPPPSAPAPRPMPPPAPPRRAGL